MTTTPMPPTRRRSTGAATAASRGKSLLSQGYRIEPMPQHYCYRVVRPRPVQDVTGDTIAAYHVCIAPGLESCDCAFWTSQPVDERRAACKHLIGVRQFITACAHALAPIVDLGDVCALLNIERSAQ